MSAAGMPGGNMAQSDAPGMYTYATGSRSILTTVLFGLLLFAFIAHHRRWRLHIYTLAAIASILNVVSWAIRSDFARGGTSWSNGKYAAWDSIHIVSTFFIMDLAYTLLGAWRYGVGVWEGWGSRVKHAVILWIVRIVALVFMILGLIGRNAFDHSSPIDPNQGYGLYSSYVYVYLILSIIYTVWVLKELFTYGTHHKDAGGPRRAYHYLALVFLTALLLLLRYIYTTIILDDNFTDDGNVKEAYLYIFQTLPEFLILLMCATWPFHVNYGPFVAAPVVGGAYGEQNLGSYSNNNNIQQYTAGGAYNTAGNSNAYNANSSAGYAAGANPGYSAAAYPAAQGAPATSGNRPVSATGRGDPTAVGVPSYQPGQAGYTR